MGRFTQRDERGPHARPLSDTEAANRQLVISVFEDFFRTGDFEVIRSRFSPDYVEHNVAVAGGDLAAYERFMTESIPSSPDLDLEFLQIIVDGDYVAVRMRGHIAPDLPVDNLMATYRIEDGRIAEHWETVAPIPDDSLNPVGAF